MLFSQSPADPLGEATIGGTCAYVQTFFPYKGFTTSGSLDPHEQCYVLRKELCGISLADFAKTGAILDFTHDTCEMRSLVTCNNWPRVISNHRKLTCINFFCSSKSVMLARLLLRKHFQILGSYFLPHTNTVILLDSYCGIIKETGGFPPGFPNYLESVRVDIGFPVVRTYAFVPSVYDQVITKCFWSG